MKHIYTTFFDLSIFTLSQIFAFLTAHFIVWYFTVDYNVWDTFKSYAFVMCMYLLLLNIRVFTFEKPVEKRFTIKKVNGKLDKDLY